MAHFCGKTHSQRDRRLAFEERDRVLAPAAGIGFPRPAPTHEQVARLAYSYWEARGRRDGSAEEDWLRAEAELLGQ